MSLYLARYIPTLILCSAMSMGLALNAAIPSAAYAQSTSDVPIEKTEVNKKKEKTYAPRDREKHAFDVTFKVEIGSIAKLVPVSSENSKLCTHLAGLLAVKADYLNACDAALEEPELSEQNRHASLLNKSLMLEKLERETEAVEVLTAMTQTYPDFGEPHYNLARLSFNAANYPGAIVHANEALNRNLPRSTRVYHLIGMAHEIDFEFTHARMAYEAALALNPGAAPTRQKLKRLNRLWPAN